MKKLLTATLMAALVSGFAAPQTATAGDDKVLAAIGGFIGGVIVGSQIGDDHRPPAAVYHAPRHGASVAVVVGSRRAHRGYWDWVTVQTWVPGAWVVSFDDCGRRYRHFERGHYELRRERVWVTANGRGYRRR